MRDLKAELIDLIDRYQAKFNSAIAAEIEDTNVGAEAETQTKADPELLSIIDKALAELDNANADESEDQNCSAQIDTRTKADPALLEIIDNALAETSDTSDNTETQSDDSFETQIDSAAETETQIVLPVELPIYETTTRQLDYWHAFGSNVHLQMLLRWYELDFSTYENRAYDEFKIGFDEKRHVATFAIDETHYYTIQFNEKNSAPVNRADADLVLREIQRLQVLRDPTINFD